MPKVPLFSVIGAVYFNIANKLKAGLSPEYRNFAFRKYPELVSVFGCEGDKDAPIAFIDGSYLLRDGLNKVITFGVDNIDGKIEWYNAEGILPCLVSKYSKDNVNYTIMNFSDKLTDGDKIYDVAYSRIIAENNSNVAVKLGKVSKYLTPLTEEKTVVNAGKTVIRDYAICADRFGNNYKRASAEFIKSQGGFDKHYEVMKAYWLKRLEPLTEITELPDKKLIDAYKVGYIYTMICKDGYELHVGENGYDRVFDHDVIGILNTLLLLGDFKDVEKYSEYILKNVQYPDARWKYSWFFAVYLQKTGRIDFVRNNFNEIKNNAHSIAECRVKNGIMKDTPAIDSLGAWTVDNFSAMTGLICYKYICERLGNAEEAKWAEEEYKGLFAASDEQMRATIKKYNLDYLPMNMKMPNSETARSDPRDANRLSMFLFGRFNLDGWLFGAEQNGSLTGLIDATYEHSALVRKDVSDSFYNFGGYPHGYYCSSYNAGYGSAALMGEKYRDAGIKAYQFMIEHAQSGPYSWWEGIKYPDEKSIWNIDHASGGGGSCPHMWGQSAATKVLIDSIICEKADGTLVVGRGIPKEWIYDGSIIEIKKYPVSDGRVDLKIEISNNEAIISLTNAKGRKIQVDIPAINSYKTV